VYRPKTQAGTPVAEKSLAIRLVLKRDDAVLTEQEIESAVGAVVQRMGDVLGARQRA
jgi:phenylalanyl-tRNA synthetase beta chain